MNRKYMTCQQCRYYNPGDKGSWNSPPEPAVCEHEDGEKLMNEYDPNRNCPGFAPERRKKGLNR